VIPERHNALTPEALTMVDTIARAGSFAAAARELGKVPSALTYSVRQLEDALDVLLFDRSTRQARLTAAGTELLNEGRRLLQQMEAVANRVRRVATGWETQLTITVDNILAPSAIFELVEAFYALRIEPVRQHAGDGLGEPGTPPTRLQLRQGVLSGSWESLVTGQSDLAIGVAVDPSGTEDIRCEEMGELTMSLAMAPHHALANAAEPIAPGTLARHRVVAIADSAHRLAPMTVNIVPGQDVLTVSSLAAKLECILRGLGCGMLPDALTRRHVEAGRLVLKAVAPARRGPPLHYAWRASSPPGHALAWWLAQLQSPVTRRALLEQYAGLIL
jgi:DNA-binding transcriptional LysR family regulator